MRIYQPVFADISCTFRRHITAFMSRSKPHRCRPVNCNSVFKTRITVSRKARIVEALTKLTSNRQMAELLFFLRPSYLLSVPDKPQLSPERDCNVNKKTEGMSVEFGFRDAKRIEPLCSQTSNQRCLFFPPSEL